MLGVPHPDFLLRLLSSSQWRDWIEYTNVEPVGDEREDWRAAVAAAGVASCWVGADAAPLDAFRIDWWRGSSAISLDARISHAVTAHNLREEALHG